MNLVSECDGWVATLRFEFTKLRRSLLPRITLATLVVATLIAGSAARSLDPLPTGHALLAEILGTTLGLAVFFLLIQGSLAVNDEVSSSALRAVLMRPVTRHQVLGAKLITLLLFTVVVFLVTVGTALGFVAVFDQFGPVTGDFGGFIVEKFTLAEINRLATKLILVALPGLWVAAVIGLGISVFVDSTGTSVALSVFCLGASKAAAGFGEHLREWSFTTFTDRPLEWHRQLAAAIEENATRVENLSLFSMDVLRPLTCIAVITSVSWFHFTRRNIRC